MIFAPLHNPSRVKGYSELLLCEAPKRWWRWIDATSGGLEWIIYLFLSHKSNNFIVSSEIIRPKSHDWVNVRVRREH